MISLDGVMQAPGGPKEDTSGGFKYGGWTASYGDEVFGKWCKKNWNLQIISWAGKRSGSGPTTGPNTGTSGRESMKAENMCFPKT